MQYLNKRKISRYILGRQTGTSALKLRQIIIYYKTLCQKNNLNTRINK